MARKDEQLDQRDVTAHHEAAHAVLYIVLALGCNQATIDPNEDTLEAGSATHGGGLSEWEGLADDVICLRRTVCLYAGGEASRRFGDTDWRDGAEDDYWPEIDAIAEALCQSTTLLGDEVGRIFRESWEQRGGRNVKW